MPDQGNHLEQLKNLKEEPEWMAEVALPPANRGRLAFEIAIGIWLGGMALTLTWLLAAGLFAKALITSLMR